MAEEIVNKHIIFVFVYEKKIRKNDNFENRTVLFMNLWLLEIEEMVNKKW